MEGTSQWLRGRGRPARRALAVTVTLGELSGILLLLQTALLVRIGDGVIFRGSGTAELAPAFAALLAVIAVRALLTWGARRAAFSCASAVKQTLRAEILGRLRGAGPAVLSGMRAGEVATTAVDAVEALDPYFSKYLPQRAVATLLPFTILAVVFPLDWISGLVLVLTAVFLPASMIVIGREAHERNQRLWGKLTRMSGRFLDVLRGLPTVRMFGAARREAELLARSSEEYRRATLSVLRVAFVSSLMLELISTVSIAIVAVICGLRLLHGTMGFAPGYFILLIAPEYFLTLRALGTYYHSRMEAASAAEHVRALLELPQSPGFAAVPSPAPRSAASGPRAPVPPGARPPAIAFRGVSFSYPGRPVLDGASFSVAAGEHAALTGESGAGKSTILALLLGFSIPGGGEITADGVPLSALDPGPWRARIAWLPQRPTLFHGTIRENIRLGRQGAGEDEVREAARLARVEEFAGRLPLGLDSPVGERGEGLSGGQAQRVALARLFLRGPGLVLLDEPTAHLDAESAALVEEGIRVLAAGRTLIVVTHRAGTAAAAGRALILAGGTVREAAQ
jgi:ATP-binding cassette, subfamily C, bacterial CydD